MNNSCNNSCNNNSDCVDKFLYIWRNKYLKNKIIDYLRYEKNYNVLFYNINSIRNYSDKEYIRKLNIDATFSGEKLFLSYGDLPVSNIRSLKINYLNKCFINKGSIPDTVEKLNIKNTRFFNKIKLVFSKDFVFPSSITKLNVGRNFEQFKKCGIPDSVKSLKIGNYSKDSLRIGDLKNTIKELKIGKCDVSLLDFVRLEGPNVFPNSLTALKVSSYSSISLLKSKDYPLSLVELSIDGDFSIPTIIKPNSLPTTITKLLLNTHIKNKLVKDIIPRSVKHLSLGSNFQSFLIPYESLPLGLISLTFLGANDRSNKYNCTEITLSNRFKSSQISSGGSNDSNVISNDIIDNKQEESRKLNIKFNYLLKDQKVKERFHYPISYGPYINKGSFPSSILYLNLGNVLQDLQSEIIPPNCVKLVLGELFDYTLFSNSIPSSVKSLSISNNKLIKPIHESIISNLDELIIVNYKDLNSTITIKSPKSKVINNKLYITPNKYIKIINNNKIHELFPALPNLNNKNK